MLRYEALLFFKCVAVTQKPVSSWQWLWKENETKITFPRAVHIHTSSMLRANSAFKHCYIIAPSHVFGQIRFKMICFMSVKGDECCTKPHNDFDFNFCSMKSVFLKHGRSKKIWNKIWHKTKICIYLMILEMQYMQ